MGEIFNEKKTRFGIWKSRSYLVISEDVDIVFI